MLAEVWLSACRRVEGLQKNRRNATFGLIGLSISNQSADIASNQLWF
jgi:hypothetical protein